jgi:hypothetical protein
MNPELTERLFAAFPQLFRGRHLPITQNLMGFGFECEDGWYDLIRRLAADIAAHAADAGLNPLAVQVKQELGTLRFSVAQADAHIHALCAAAERQSSLTCERCGMPGRLRYHRRQLLARCDAHAPPGSWIAAQQPPAVDSAGPRGA